MIVIIVIIMVVIIGSLGTVSMGGTSFLAEPELDTFSNYVKMSFLGGIGT